MNEIIDELKRAAEIEAYSETMAIIRIFANQKLLMRALIVLLSNASECGGTGLDIGDGQQ